jgi:hypothetical protein
MSLDERLSRLEIANQRWRIAAILGLASMSLFVLLGLMADADTSLEATEFRVRDAEGRIVARLGVSKSGDPELQLLDRNGQPRATMMVRQAEAEMGDDGVSSVLLLTGANKLPGVTLGAGSNVRMISIADLGGDERLQFRVSQGGAPGLTKAEVKVKDAGGSDLLAFGTAPMSLPRPADRGGEFPMGNPMPKPSPFLTLAQPAGGRVMMRVWGDGEPSLDLWSKAGEAVLKAP